MKMRTNHVLWGIGVVLLLGWAGISLAASPPERINLQGVLRDNAGAPVDGTQAMTFRLYDTDVGCPGGGTLLLTDEHASVGVSGGLFNVVLGGGSVTPGGASSLGEAFKNNAEVWVEIGVGVETLCDRVRVESAAYAQLAGGLRTLDNVGIGTTAPAGQLHVLRDGFFADARLTGYREIGDRASLRFEGARGSVAAPAVVQDNDTVGSIAFKAYDGVNFLRSVAAISASVDGTPGFADTPGRLLFSTTADGSGSPSPRMTIKSDGNVGIGTTSPSETLTVIGTIESASGGFKFPDGSTQTSALNTLPPDTCFDNVGRYVVCGNGAVKDNLTGLFWLESANCLGSDDWAAANILAAQLADGQCGLTDGSSPGDWRLPTDAEWQVIVDQANANGCPGPFVPDTQGLGCWSEGDPFSGVQSEFYWSSTSAANNPNLAWIAVLGNGNVVTTSKTNVNRVWPVRGGP